MTRGVLFPWLVGSALVLFCLGVCSRIDADPESAPVSPDEALQAFRAQLDEVLTAPVLTRARVGVAVIDCSSGEMVYARDPDLLLNPASNLKVLTSAVALSVLGPAFRFRTSVLYDGTLNEGVLSGNLYLRGEGDPELVYETVWKMVKDLQAQGLTTIMGDLVADDTFFDEQRLIPDWNEDDLDDETHAYNAPLGALSFNFNTVALVVRPGATVKAPVRITFETPTGYVRIENRATTGGRNSKPTLRFSRRSEDSGPELVLEGRLPINSGFKRYYRTVPNPPQFALTLMSEMMAREGIVIRGGRRLGRTPDGAVALHYHHSSSLDILMKHMNKLSSNFIAEQTVKAMGARVYGAPGTTEKGIQVMRDYLQQAKLPWDTSAFYNGSGLSYRTRVSARQLAGVLCYVERDHRQRYDFLATFPIAGVDGTLRRRMIGTGAEGNLRAKTGSIKGIFGFSGLLESQDQRNLAFSFLVNDIEGKVAEVRQAQDRWAGRLAAGPVGSSTMTLSPLETDPGNEEVGGAGAPASEVTEDTD